MDTFKLDIFAIALFVSVSISVSKNSESYHVVTKQNVTLSNTKIQHAKIQNLVNKTVNETFEINDYENGCFDAKLNYNFVMRCV